MKRFLRRIRGVIGTGITWALAWVPFGVLWGFGDWLLFPDSTPLSYLLLASAALFGGVGFAGGTIFSLILNRIEGKRTFEQMTVRRFIRWGALGGILLSTVLILSNGVGQLSLADIVALGILPLLGTASAAGSLMIARSADTKLIEGEEDSLLSLEEALEPKRIG